MIALRVLWPWAVAALAVLGYGCEQRKAGALDAQLAIRTRERDALAKAAKIVRTQYVHDTVRVTKTTTRYETLRDSVLRTDTLLAHDTTFVRVVASADTAIQACRDVVRSCTKSLALADSIHAVDQRMIRALTKAKPGAIRRWTERLVWGSVGYTIATVTR